MAAIYDVETGEMITEGLQGCKTCAEAQIVALRTALDRDKPVRLSDDDGDWIIITVR